MTPTDAVKLARYIRAHFPSQPIDEFTADALAETLAQYSLDDARTAVLNIAERGEQWCAPTAVKAEVKRIRAKRIAEDVDLTPPLELDPDDTGAYAAWLASARLAAADGGKAAQLAARDIRSLGQIGRPVRDA